MPELADRSTRPLPPRAAGEEDYRASGCRRFRQDPCHLVWQVNKIFTARAPIEPAESDSPAGQARRGLLVTRPVQLARKSRSPAGRAGRGLEVPPEILKIRRPQSLWGRFGRAIF